MSRRQYKSGSVFQRKDGMWIGRAEAGTDSNGRRRRIQVSAVSEPLCKERLENEKRRVARLGVDGATSGRVTVETWAEEWLGMIVHDLRPKAYTTTASCVKQWIIPTLGRKRLSALTPADIRRFHDAMRAPAPKRPKGLAQSTLVRYHGDLMLMLEAAMLEGHDVPQRVMLVKRPTLGESDREAIPVDDAMAMLKIVADWPHGSMWGAALLQGIRQAERLGLTWECVDFDRDLIDISWQLQPLPYIDRKHPELGVRVPDTYLARHLVDAFYLVRPKSKSSRRVIPMVPWMRDALIAWREVSPPNDYDLVWPRLDGRAAGKPQRAEADLAEWKRIQELADVMHPAGRRYLQHEARHTTATLLLDVGVDRHVVEAILGHSKFVEAYDHSNRDVAKREALERVAERLALVV